ncbi:MAG: tetratricopeptide repeat protein [Acidobacteriota bacterium]
MALVAGWQLTAAPSAQDAEPEPAASQPEAPAEAEATDPLAARGHSVTGGAAPGYVADQLCGSCHRDLYDSYQEVAMARSFYRPDPAKDIEDFEKGYFHAASRRHYTMERRDADTLVMTRYQLDDRGERINVVEQEVDWILGSGNHSRTYIFRTPSGNLYQMPIAWYTQTNKWAMAPGFEEADHLGMTRRVHRECMFCHNAYPDVAEGSDNNLQPHFFPEELPEGLGCQRCHGPGAEHVRAAMSESVDFKAVYGSILNPADLDVDLRNDVCYQCHMQPTVALPGQRRFGRRTYSYRPGEPLDEYMVRLDIVEAGRERVDRFDINHHPYRLEQSRCFIESAGAMSCMSCHDPHRKVPVAERVTHYRAACLKCHEVDACQLEEMTADASLPDVAADNCVGCHMQERRTEDVIEVTMTDHYIRRRPGGPELVAPMEPKDPNIEDVIMFSRDHGLPTELADVYRATAVLKVLGRSHQGAKTALQERLPRVRPRGLEPYIELARAQLTTGELDEAANLLQQVLTIAPEAALARDILALTESRRGRFPQAMAHLEEVLANHPPERPETHFNLGLVLFQVERHEEARIHLARAVELRPVMAPAWFYLGLTQIELGQLSDAADSLLQTVALDPSHNRAYVPLGQVLIRLNRAAEAERYWKHGIKHSKAPSAIAAARARAAAAASSK